MEFLLLIALWLLAPILFAVLFVLPLKLMVNSLYDLVHVPSQIVAIAFNRRLRMNHALEHATINVLQSRYGAAGLAGYARENGFLISGWHDPRSLEIAAREALMRLSLGERHLAVHNKCGTSRAVGNFFFAVLFLTVLLVGGHLDLLTIMAAGVALFVISPVVGMFIQRTLTTHPRVKELAIEGVAPVYSQAAPTSFFGLALFPRAPEAYFVSTVQRR